MTAESRSSTRERSGVAMEGIDESACRASRSSGDRGSVRIGATSGCIWRATWVRVWQDEGEP